MTGRYHPSTTTTARRHPGKDADPNRHIGREVVFTPNGSRIDYQRWRFAVKDTGLPSTWAMREDIDTRAGFSLDYPRDAETAPRFHAGDEVWIALIDRYLCVRVDRVYGCCGRNAVTLAFEGGVEVEDVLEAQLAKLVCPRRAGLLGSGYHAP